MSDSEVETVTVLIAGLELTISARRLTASGPTSVEVTSVPSAEGAAASANPHSISENLEDQSIRARTAGALANLPLSFLSGYRTRLRGTDPVWTAQARIGRAFRAGVIARRQLAGNIQEGQSQGIPFRNAIYVVLRDRDQNGAFWTSSYQVYARAVFLEGIDVFGSNSISHAFPSQAEAEVYCVAARTQWPPERQG